MQSEGASKQKIWGSTVDLMIGTPLVHTIGHPFTIPPRQYFSNVFTIFTTITIEIHQIILVLNFESTKGSL